MSYTGLRQDAQQSIPTTLEAASPTSTNSQASSSFYARRGSANNLAPPRRSAQQDVVSITIRQVGEFAARGRQDRHERRSVDRDTGVRRSLEMGLTSLKQVRYQAKMQQKRAESQERQPSSLAKERYLYKSGLRPDSSSFTHGTQPDMQRSSSVSAVPPTISTVGSQSSLRGTGGGASIETRMKLEEIEQKWRQRQHDNSKRHSQERYMKFKSALTKSQQQASPPVKAKDVAKEMVKRVMAQRREERFETVGGGGASDKIRVEEVCRPQRKQTSKELFQKYFLSQAMASQPRRMGGGASKPEDLDSNVSIEKQEGSINSVYQFGGRQGVTEASPLRRSMVYGGGARTKSTSPGVRVGQKESGLSEMVLLKAKNLNESLKRAKQQQGGNQERMRRGEVERFNFAQRNEILIKEYSKDDQEREQRQLTTESPTFKKVVQQFRLGSFSIDHHPIPSALSARKRTGRTPQQSERKSKKVAKARGTSQQHQRDWKPVRVDVKLEDLQTRDIASESHTYAVPSRANSPKVDETNITSTPKPSSDSKPMIGSKFNTKKTVSDQKKPNAYGARKGTAGTKRSGPSSASKNEGWLKRRSSLTQEQGRQLKTRAEPKSEQVKKSKDYTYGEQKKNFPFNPVYTPSREPMAQALTVPQILLTEESPQPVVVAKKAAEPERVMAGVPSRSIEVEVEEKKTPKDAKKELVQRYLKAGRSGGGGGSNNKGFERFQQKEAVRRREEDEEDERIRVKLSRLLESTRQLYNN